LFGATDYTATAGDVLTFMSLGSGNWRQIEGPNVVTAATGVTINRGANSAAVAVTNPVTVIYARSTGNETVNTSSTLQDDDQLVIALAASTNYAFQCYISYNSGTTPDIKFAFTVPSGATIRWGAPSARFEPTGTASVSTSVTASGSSLGFTGDASNDLDVLLTGTVANSTNAGNLTLQWAQQTSTASDTIRRANSWCRAEKIS